MKWLVKLFSLTEALLGLLRIRRSAAGTASKEIGHLAPKEKEPIRFNGILTKRPEGMDYATYRALLKQQNLKLNLYLRNKRYTGFMGHSLNAYNSPNPLS